MKLAEFLKAERGRVAKVARRARIAPSFLSQMSNGTRPIPPGAAPRIEAATDGSVMRWEMFPDNWYENWPELVSKEGAPPVPASASQVEEVSHAT